MADFNTVATQFTEYYYTTFDNNRSQLVPLYDSNESLLTFEGAQVQGAKAIMEKLETLPFTKVLHKISTLDAQPADPSGAILVLVTGQLLIDDGEHPQSFSQTFHLIPRDGSYYVRNDVFRLVYG
ncbi:nuclear transport factor Nxt2 [Sphaerosporella brunnea]|uniref:Nuclear transport factor 2 n=1 Tax=Sphaerosporella brunnea TaxID=1250544 RepID=A0A5J5ERU1_9PEZI|nr:nuclear transport factor Nxt2 [Sphaerosporella brunnea]